MKRLSAALLTLLLAGSLLWGADPVKVQPEIRFKAGRLAKLEASSDAKTPIRWVNLSADLDCLPFEQGRAVVLGASLPGTYRIAAIVGDAAGASDPVYVQVVVTGDVPPPPIPPGPVPPGPMPGPVTGLRVLILYESGELAKMPAAQQSILFAKSIRDYLNLKCVAGPDGKTKEFRIWDKDVDASGESKPWQDLMARPRTAVPWLVISGDKGPAFEGPLPATVDDALTLFKKYGS